MKGTCVGKVKRCALFVTSLLVFASCPSSGAGDDQQSWPVVALPQEAIAYSIGDHIIVNGIPMRMKGFVARTGPQAMNNWFRRRLGEPMVETKRGNELILGKAKNGYFITIKMTAAGTGTNGILTVSHLVKAYESRDKTRAMLRRLLARLPAGSKIDAEMVSTDGGKLSRYYVFSNTHNEELNRERIQDLMREDGMKLQYRGSTRDGKIKNRIPHIFQSGMALFFRGEKKEAIAVIASNTEGVTVVQVNVVSEPGMRNE